MVWRNIAPAWRQGRRDAPPYCAAVRTWRRIALALLIAIGAEIVRGEWTRGGTALVLLRILLL